jgi:hypothetical protein
VSASTRIHADDVLRDLERLLLCATSARESLLNLRHSAASADEATIREAYEHWLYEKWYSRPAESSTPAPNDVHTNLPSALRAALPGSTRWLTGWVVMSLGAYGACVAGRRSLVRELRCGEYANVSRPGVPVMPGDGIVVMECVDWIDRQTGFWFTRSPLGDPDAPLVRVYWSVSEHDIAWILRDLAVALESLGVRYSLKCPVRSADFVRVDTLVLYLERSAWENAESAIEELAHRCEPRLRESSPPLTRRIARGVAFAEDPGPKESFGQSRCRALAPGLLALLEGSPSRSRGIEILVQALRDAGIDPERPWMNAVS